MPDPVFYFFKLSCGYLDIYFRLNIFCEGKYMIKCANKMNIHKHIWLENL